jgi:hypothetical protein
MQIAVVIEGQMNLSYEQQLAAARRAEAVSALCKAARCGLSTRML